ncbi:MAG: hypothetical protein ACE14V_08580 [bacterium]
MDKLFNYTFLGLGFINIVLSVLWAFIQENTWLDGLMVPLWENVLGCYILLIPVCLVFVSICFIKEKVKNNKYRWVCFTPLLIAILCLILSVYISYELFLFVKDRQFQKNFLLYDQMKNKIKLESKDEINSDKYYPAPKGFPAYGITKRRNDKGTLIVVFRTNFAMDLGGYVYISDDHPDNFLIKTYNFHKIKPYWYRWHNSFFGDNTSMGTGLSFG